MLVFTLLPGHDGLLMKGRNKKGAREKDLTSRYTSGGLDEDSIDSVHRFSTQSKRRQATKTARTTEKRAQAETGDSNSASLMNGEVIQVYSRYCDVVVAGDIWLCVIRKTLTKNVKGDLVVGDLVRFTDMGTRDESGRPEGIIEQILPRTTVLTRADSFKQIVSHPIVANAKQMLIVASVQEPNLKWGLIDRMIVAAQAGGLVPIVCLNKIDLLKGTLDPDPREVLSHYESLGIPTFETSVTETRGLDILRDRLRDQTTVLAGHSGVGKSSLIRAIQPQLDLSVGAISNYTGKGRHTTTSARRYILDFGGYVIDTPGVKLFGLWNVTRDTLPEYFPDVATDTAPEWRRESFRRIEESLSD